MITSPAQRPVSQQFEFVREWDDEFLQLFPHRGDYLWAEHPEPGKRPEWRTESRHLLSDRTIKQGAYLFGVRFGSTTKYLVLDIDVRSHYHPRQDPFAVWSMVEALEPLGLVSYVAVASSGSGGIHLYFPFEEAQASWAIALATRTLLENKGFKFQGGQLEIFPNSKPYSEVQTNYNGHRLPLQQGSYLLNQEWENIFTTQTAFVQQWKFAERKNSVSREEVDRVVQNEQRKHYSKNLKVSGQKYYSDLCNDLKDGFTGSGQTQPLFAKVANRERVFYHAVYGGRPLEGESLANRIAEVVRSLPGFEEFCGHKHEVENLARSWARAAERRYYPYGSKKPLLVEQNDRDFLEAKEPSWNQRQAQDARERILRAVADLLDRNALPAQATARRNALRAYGVGNTTLDKNRDLWHPEDLNPSLEGQYHAAQPDLEGSDHSGSLTEGQYHPIVPNKLLELPASAPTAQEAGETNTLAVGGSGGLSTGGSCEDGQLTLELQPTKSPNASVAQLGLALIREVLNRVAVRSQRSKQHTRLVQPPLDEDYFRNIGLLRGGDRPKQVQQEFVQQSLELSPTTPLLPVLNPAIQARLLPHLLNLIRFEIVSLGWLLI